MKEYENLKVEVEEGIATITIDREAKLNALNRKTMSELKSFFLDSNKLKTYQGIILTGAGEKSFVAGADISEFSALDEEMARSFAEEGQKIFDLIEKCPIPNIGVINGFALGGGCELAMACHMRIATANAKFGQPEVNLGIIPGYGGTQRLTRLIGRGRAMEYILTGDMINADSAVEMGLANHSTINKEEALNKAHEILKKIASKAPVAVKMSIKAVNAVPYDESRGYGVEAEAFAKCSSTADFKEGALAFVEKRKPNFIGS